MEMKFTIIIICTHPAHLILHLQLFPHSLVILALLKICYNVWTTTALLMPPASMTVNHSGMAIGSIIQGSEFLSESINPKEQSLPRSKFPL